jgi:hypothetical protein
MRVFKEFRTALKTKLRLRALKKDLRMSKK